MKGRQKGRPTKWVTVHVAEHIDVGKRGVEFEVWDKWKKTPRKRGTLVVTVGGLAWRPQNGKHFQRRSWDKVADWFEQSPGLGRV